MSLIYNVVIIDDKKLFYSEYKDIIDEHLGEQGFEATVDYISSEADFNKYPLDKPDLFLVDLKFGQVDKGQNFINLIRNSFLTDILFYSSDHEAIQGYRQDVKMQGIFFAERDDQNDEVEPLLLKLLDKMIIKANSPRSTRGIVMECVAELDDLIKKKIILLNTKVAKEDLTIIHHKIIKVIKDSADGRNRKINSYFGVNLMGDKIEFSSIEGFLKELLVEDLIENINITDSNKNLKCLLVLYHKIYGKNELYFKLADYEKLLDKRNILAHVSQEIHESGYIFKSRMAGGKDYILDEPESITIRKEIVNLYKLVNQIN